MCVIPFHLSKETYNVAEDQTGTGEVGVFQFPYKGSRVFLVDTPGFDDTQRSDSEVLKDVAFWLAAAYTKAVRLAGIIYLHRIIDPRMQGSALKNLRMFQKLCGDGNLGSVILATTHWHNRDGGPAVTEEVGRERVKQLIDREDFWGSMVHRGSRVLRHDGSKASALAIVSTLVDQKIKVTLDIQRQMVDQHKSLDDTDAGQALRGELIAERKRFERKLKDLEADLNDALHANDEAWRQEIEKEKKEFHTQIEKSDREREALKIDLQKIAEEKGKQYQALAEKIAEQEKKYQAEREEQQKRLDEFREQQRQRAEREAKERQELDEKYRKLEEKRREDEAQFQQKLLQAHSENEQRILKTQHQAEKDALEAELRNQKEIQRVKEEQVEVAADKTRRDVRNLSRQTQELIDRQNYMMCGHRLSKSRFFLLWNCADSVHTGDELKGSS
jgi:hypothetical protein